MMEQLIHFGMDAFNEIAWQSAHTLVRPRLLVHEHYAWEKFCQSKIIRALIEASYSLWKCHL